MDDDSRSEPGLSFTLWETLRPGARFVVRSRLPDGSSHTFTDAVGEVVEISAGHVCLQTRRHGVVRIARADVSAVKPLGPAPTRGRPGMPGPEDQPSSRAD